MKKKFMNQTSEYKLDFSGEFILSLSKGTLVQECFAEQKDNC